MRLRFRAVALACAALSLAFSLAFSAPVLAEDEIETTVTIRDHKFEPAEIKIPAGRAIKITVNNLDATAEEFESYPLGFEKVIAGQQSAVVRLKPLEKGNYPFFGEYHEATAQGAVIAE